MQLKLGDPVRSQDGHDIGTIKYLILEPSSTTVKTVVLERGWLLPDDIEVPLEGIQETEDQGIRLAYTAAQVEDLPRFDESRYTLIPLEPTQPFLNYPFGGMLWPHDGAFPLIVPSALSPLPSVADTEADTQKSEEATEREKLPTQREQSSAVISAGNDVLSREGEKLGEVHSVAFDSKTGQPTSLVVRHGKLFFEDRELPADSIASIHDGTVHLNLSKERALT
jgi:uncharacterized protein YrrD